ncbi:uncharacterized protein BP5553_07243 [Venustampulla echinocandica]|uniref:Uncharacterized protein n=1 Tax=Venustampulla echinocandica TaxID=2656787 RepID=A0A370TIZ3_9HELO|nr:uncharacterized protein BP5553_07243 [Venustampulla echinocandica]RDL35312.1 hypothetical protein BP5553_07243 [Venustampulla echinocandica]
MGLPIFGTSNYTSAQWVPEPNRRGTWDLVQSCVLTLGLCIYSAFHLNVFHRECKWWIRFLVQTKWLVVALLAPEFIVFNAWAQRRQAVRIAKMLRKRSGQEEVGSWFTRLCKYFRRKLRLLDQERGQQPAAVQNQQQDGPQLPQTTDKIEKVQDTAISLQEDPSPNIPEERFELIHGFLIVMGGLLVDMSGDDERVWPQWCNTLTMTPACAEECLGKSAFEDIDLSFLTREKINARQKVDHFAKTLIVMQALWFCIQFIFRICQSLPVSLLELNTFAHSLCALFIYILWWHKPGSIDEPFIIHTGQSSALRDLCAAQWTLGASGKFYEGQKVVTKDPKKQQEQQDSPWTPMFVHGGSEFTLNFFRGRRGITLCPGSGEDWYIFNHKDRWFYFPHLPETDRFNLRVCGHDQNPTVRLEPGKPIPGTSMHLSPRFESLELDTITLERWRRALKSEAYNCNYTVWLRDRQPNFSWPRGLDSDDGPAIGEELMKSLTMLTVTSLFYGSIHMLAWNSNVLRTTGKDQIFWKLSCLQLMVLGPFALAIWTGLKMRGSDAHLRLNQALSIGFSVLGIVVFLSYMMSRVYLVVEIIIVLPYVDPRVYEMPDFAVYWPHFG